MDELNEILNELSQDRSQMSAADLRASATRLRKAALAALRESHDADTRARAREAREFADSLDDEANLVAADENRPVVEASDDSPEDTPDEDDADDDDEPSDQAAPQGSPAPVVHTEVELASVVDIQTRRPLTPDLIYAVDNSAGVLQGKAFNSWGDFGMALVDRAKGIRADTDERFEVGRIIGQYPEDRQLTMDPFHNLRILDTLNQYGGSVEEITAALCAPFTPYYNLACLNTTRRPVAGSLPGFSAPRGGATIYPSPSLADVAGSAGIWTRDDDANPSAVKNACATITCAESEEFVMYGVYWCLTVKNMLALTFPELLAAYMNRGMANFARIAETQLLDLMGTAASTINVTPTLGYGATLRVATQILHYLTLYRELQRWDDVPMVGWAPRWLLRAFQIDLSRRRRDGTWEMATEAQVNAAFAAAGVSMTWYLDDPVWGTPPPAALATNGNESIGLLGDLSPLPTEADILIAPAGKFAMIDRAQLSIGVTGNNWYRDNVSNSKNEVTYFWENYEGIVDTTSCDAHILHFEGLCYNGAQIADAALQCSGEAAA